MNPIMIVHTASFSYCGTNDICKINQMFLCALKAHSTVIDPILSSCSTHPIKLLIFMFFLSFNQIILKKMSWQFQATTSGRKGQTSYSQFLLSLILLLFAYIFHITQMIGGVCHFEIKKWRTKEKSLFTYSTPYWSKSAASKYCRTLNLLIVTMSGNARRWEL